MSRRTRTLMLLAALAPAGRSRPVRWLSSLALAPAAPSSRPGAHTNESENQ